MECEYIQLKTKDGVELYGTYVRVEKDDAPAIVLLHMMPATKESWEGFQEMLADSGFQSLAIDLRGHGESVFRNGQPIDYRQFSDVQQQEKVYDAEAATGFFIARGIPFELLCFVGASIGANLALQEQARHPEIKASVLLSPGFDYRGIVTEPLARAIREEQSVFLAGAKEDMQQPEDSCADMAQVLFDALVSKNKKIAIFEGAGHGTGLFAKHPGLEHEIIAWLTKIYL